MKHENNGRCLKCQQILNRYAGFETTLRAWFEDLQAKLPEAHISCAGRGKQDQEMLFQRRASKARFGESAHNYNAAIDIFENQGKPLDIYEVKWFKQVLAPHIPPWVKWYGEPGSRFWELPHVELRDWRELSKQGILRLIGEDTGDAKR